MAETLRDETGRFLPLDQVDQKTYNRVRDAGKEEIDDEVEDEKPPELTGKEPLKDFKKIREAQINQKSGAGVQKRIDRLVKESKTAQKEAAALRERLARYESGQQANSGEESGARAGEPSEEEKAELQRVIDRHHARIEHARKNIPDYEKRLAAAPELRLTDEMNGRIMDLDNGIEVGLYILEHPEISKELQALPTAKAIERISKIAWRLEYEAMRDDLADKIADKIPKFSPIRPVSSGSTRSSVPLDEMPMEQFKKARAAGRVR
jgi:hypothetical protein